MSSWLGVGILVCFSLGLTLFMRLDFGRSSVELPRDLGRWTVVPGESDSGHPGAVVERRVLLVEGGLFRRHRLVEQRRARMADTGEVLLVLPERTLRRWFSI